MSQYKTIRFWPNTVRKNGKPYGVEIYSNQNGENEFLFLVVKPTMQLAYEDASKIIDGLKTGRITPKNLKKGIFKLNS